MYVYVSVWVCICVCETWKIEMTFSESSCETLNIKMTLNQWYNAIGIAGQFNFFCIKCHRPVYAIDWNRNVNMFEPSLKWNSIKLPNLSRKLRFKWHFLCQSVARINTICVISRVGSSLLSKHAFSPSENAVTTSCLHEGAVEGFIEDLRKII